MRLPFETDAGLGHRARLGVILLRADETLEHELRVMLPLDGVALYHTRIPMQPQVQPDALAGMEQDIPAATALLPEITFDVIGYACTSAATVIGSQNVARAVQSVCPSAQVTDPLRAIIAGGRALGVKRLGFLTPYVPEVSRKMQNALTEAGFEIVSFGSFEADDDRVVARISEAAILAAAEKITRAASCEALVISCTNLRCLNVMRRLETQLGMPVLSSNQALFWHMMQLAGVRAQLGQFGRLFETARTPS